MKKILCIVCCLLLPLRAFAAGCDCGSVNAIVTNAKIETIQLVNANTTLEANAIRAEILLAAQSDYAILGTIKTEFSVIILDSFALKESNVAPNFRGQRTIRRQ